MFLSVCGFTRVHCSHSHFYPRRLLKGDTATVQECLKTSKTQSFPGCVRPTRRRRGCRNEAAPCLPSVQGMGTTIGPTQGARLVKKGQGSLMGGLCSSKESPFPLLCFTNSRHLSCSWTWQPEREKGRRVEESDTQREGKGRTSKRIHLKKLVLPVLMKFWNSKGIREYHPGLTYIFSEVVTGNTVDKEGTEWLVSEEPVTKFFLLHCISWNNSKKTSDFQHLYERQHSTSRPSN